MKTYKINNKTYSSLPDPCNGCSPMTEQRFREMGGIIEDDGQPTPFEVACSQFRQVCTMMGQFLNEPDFKGGFDEYVHFATSAEYQANPVLGNSLAIQWAGTNEYCKYEGSKIGLGQPEWWYECWRQVDPSFTGPASNTTNESEDSNESNDPEQSEETPVESDGE